MEVLGLVRYACQVARWRYLLVNIDMPWLRDSAIPRNLLLISKAQSCLRSEQTCILHWRAPADIQAAAESAARADCNFALQNADLQTFLFSPDYRSRGKLQATTHFLPRNRRWSCGEKKLLWWINWSTFMAAISKDVLQKSSFFRISQGCVNPVCFWVIFLQLENKPYFRQKCLSVKNKSFFPSLRSLKWIGEVCSFYPSARALESSKSARETLVRSLSHSPSTNQPTYVRHVRQGWESSSPLSWFSKTHSM